MTKNNDTIEENDIQNDHSVDLTAEDILEDPSSDSQKSTQETTKPKTLLRFAVYGISLIVMVLVVWGIGSLIINGFAASPEPSPTASPTVIALPEEMSTPEYSANQGSGGVIRQPEIQITVAPTNSPSKEREEVINYTVESGDTIFGIADKFGLLPQTVLWSNRYILGDTPDGLGVGLEIVIIPVDGLYHRWSEGEGLNGVSEFYGVDPDVIVDYPLNNLDRNTLGNYSNPNIEPGTMLIVPGGTRPTVTWVVARDEAASGNSYLGPGACGGIIYGNVGTGSFTWPTTATWLSGYDYTPPTHNGLDFDGDFGSPIYAADSGVIVYSGWSDRGYGNLIVIDHDGGWQTFYGHLMDGTLLPCGSNVQKGQLIASMGSTGNSTGPHLHFELRQNGYPVNPWLYLN
jgi:murein DD-endopeptidase MepM/ murein hydrolase activator NlpD